MQPGSARTGHAGAAVVIDTNCVLDLWLFDEPALAQLRQQIEQHMLHWLALPCMRQELQRVLGYPALQRQLVARGRRAEAIVAAFDAWSCLQPPPPACALRCEDPDDQPFIDLAVHTGAVLYSRDLKVRALGPQLMACGVRLEPASLRPWQDT